MRQCRICLDTENPLDMVSPCRCRGSAEFIHRRCLEDHLRFYPDRYCTVCRTRMSYMDYIDLIMLGCIVITCAMFISASSLFLPVKFAIAGMLTTSLYIYNLQYLLTSDVSLLLLLFLFGIGMSPTEMFGNALLCIAVVGLCFLTIVASIPPEFLFSFVMTLFIGLYAILFLLSIHSISDSYTVAIVFCILFLVWYGAMKFMRRIPVLRI